MTPRRARRGRRLALLWSILLVSWVGTACGSAPGTTDPQGVDLLRIPTPSPDPDDFGGDVDNPYLPLSPGSSWTYQSAGGEGPESITETIAVTVTDQARVVAGVTTTVVRARGTDAAGKLVEDAHTWYAQDTLGNVWCFGLATTAYDGAGASNEGSWEAGVDGAQAGIAMPATPRVGDGYRTGYLEGVAEEVAEVLAIDAEVALANERLDEVVQIAVTTALEPGLTELRYYAPEVGLVLEETVAGGVGRVVLVEHQPG